MSIEKPVVQFYFFLITLIKFFVVEVMLPRITLSVNLAKKWNLEMDFYKMSTITTYHCIFSVPWWYYSDN